MKPNIHLIVKQVLLKNGHLKNGNIKTFSVTAAPILGSTSL